MKGLRRILLFSLCLFCVMGQQVCAKNANNKLVILIDPGHGGIDSGAEKRYDGVKEQEKKITLTIAKFLKEELEKYEDVEVHMTREKDKYVSLADRCEKAKKLDADLMLSIHINDQGRHYGGRVRGASVIVPRGNYDSKGAVKAERLSANLLYELEGIGMKDQGLIQRMSEGEYTYPNGKHADYYAVVRKGVENGFVGVIVEEAFLDNADDFYDYMCGKKHMKKVAKANARGVARYYRLRKKKNGEQLELLEDRKERVRYIIYAGHEKKYYEHIHQVEEVEEIEDSPWRSYLDLKLYYLSQEAINLPGGLANS